MLVQPLGLSGIVAEDGRRNSVGDNLLQLPEVALNRLGIEERKDDLRILPGQIEDSERLDRRESCFGILEKLFAAGGVLTTPARQVDVVLGFRPGAVDLRLEVRAERHDEQGVPRKKCADR